MCLMSPSDTKKLKARNGRPANINPNIIEINIPESLSFFFDKKDIT